MINFIHVYNVPYRATMMSEAIRVTNVIVRTMITNLKWNINMILKIVVANKKSLKGEIQHGIYVQRGGKLNSWSNTETFKEAS